MVTVLPLLSALPRPRNLDPKLPPKSSSVRCSRDSGDSRGLSHRLFAKYAEAGSIELRCFAAVADPVGCLAVRFWRFAVRERRLRGCSAWASGPPISQIRPPPPPLAPLEPLRWLGKHSAIARLHLSSPLQRSRLLPYKGHRQSTKHKIHAVCIMWSAD